MSAWNGDLWKVPVGVSWSGCGLRFFQIDWPHLQALGPQLSHLSVSHRGEPDLPRFRISRRRDTSSEQSHKEGNGFGNARPGS